MKFYKYYPIASEDTPDITSVKVWRFLRCFQCARAGWAPCSISCFLCLFLSLTANGALSPCRRRISIATMARHIKSSRIRGVQPFAGSVLNGPDYTRLDVVSSLSESESWQCPGSDIALVHIQFSKERPIEFMSSATFYMDVTHKFHILMKSPIQGLDWECFTST